MYGRRRLGIPGTFVRVDSCLDFASHDVHATSLAVTSALVLCALVPLIAPCQTPSPLQEWQYPGGTILDKVFDSPIYLQWRVVLG